MLNELIDTCIHVYSLNNNIRLNFTRYIKEMQRKS